MKPQITSFNDIIEKYDAFFIDIWGVVHNGTTPYLGVAERLNGLIASKKVIFLSNVPRPEEVMHSSLQQYDINTLPNGILTSGDIVREELQKIPHRKIYHLGQDRNQDLLKDMPINLVSEIKKADILLLSAFLEENEKDDKFDDILHEASLLNLIVICANPDTYVPHGNHIRRCSGVIAARYEKMGGKVDYYGKPYSKVFEAALKRCQFEKKRILMIGDTFETDILGARNFGIDVAMTLTGNGQKSYGNLDALKLQYGISPTWIIEGLGY